ncbi:hypothetical protein D3C85_1455890 [compost metagenome]
MPGQVVDRAFGGAIRRFQGEAHQSADRGYVDDPATAAVCTRCLLEHLRDGVLAPQPDALGVDVHGQVVVFLGFFDDGLQRGENAGVVDHDVQPSEMLHGLLDQVLHIR